MALANSPPSAADGRAGGGHGAEGTGRADGADERIVGASGIAVLFTEHDMDVVFNTADRVIVLSAALMPTARRRRSGQTPSTPPRPRFRGRTRIAEGADLAACLCRTASSGPPGDSDPSDDFFSLAPSGSHHVSCCGSSLPPSVSASARALASASASLGTASTRRWRRRMLSASGHTLYGKAHILCDVSLAVDRARWWCCSAATARASRPRSRASSAWCRCSGARSASTASDIDRLRPHEIARLGLGYVPEERRDLHRLDGAARTSRSAASQRAEGIAPWDFERIGRLFPNLAQMPERPGGRMSGGEQQMLTIGRTLMGNPRCILLDEPSEGVAPVIVDQMAEAIRRVEGAGRGRSCCRSRTCGSLSRWPTAPISSRKAACASPVRWRSSTPSRRSASSIWRCRRSGRPR